MVRRMLVKLGIRTIVLMFTVSTQYAFAADGLLPQINDVRIGASATPNADEQRHNPAESSGGDVVPALRHAAA